MTHFLIKYDRAKGKLLDLREFADQDRERALQQQLALELAERENPDIEGVVLAASSRDQAETTHSRYFKSRRALTSPTRVDVENLISELGIEPLRKIAERAASEPSVLAALAARPRLKGIYPMLEGGPPGGAGARSLDLHRTLDALKRHFEVPGKRRTSPSRGPETLGRERRQKEESRLSSRWREGCSR
jgi:hypothetical protein